MQYDFLPENIQERVKKPFAFVSYCHQNDAIYSRVQALALYLRDKNINVLYDEGGLSPGTELTQFENLILHKNCKFVLVVCDECYLEKVENSVGGAWREYFNISNDYPHHINKYIPLIVDAKIPIFAGKVYISFTDDSEFVNIGKKLSSLSEINEKFQLKMESLVKDANQLCDNGDYSAASKKVNQAIKKFNLQSKKQKIRLAELYNIKLFIAIQKNDKNTAVKTADDLRGIISNRMSLDKKAIYYGNCALAYRMRDKESDEYEDCAEKAYVSAKKSGIDDDGYFSSMYSTALYETEQYTCAYKIANEALDCFINSHNDFSMYDSNDYISYAMRKGNVAEITAKCCEKVVKNRKDKLVMLTEAKKHVLDIINLPELDDNEKVKAEIYFIASLVFDVLKKYYLYEI